MAAAELLQSDIMRVMQDVNTYPTSLKISSVLETLSNVSESLQLFLRTLFVGKEKKN